MEQSNYPELGAQELEIRRAAAALSAAQDGFVRAAIQSLESSNRQLRRVSYPGLHLPQLRDALCEHATADACGWAPSPLRLVGSGPWEGSEFSDFLGSKGFVVTEADESVGTLVLGSRDLSTEELTAILESVNDATPVYTQELLVLGLAREEDPYALLEQDPIEAIAELHPGVALVLEAGKDWPLWPESDVDEGAEDAAEESEESSSNATYEFDMDLADSSPLHKLGYNARADGPNEQTRQGVLSRAFNERSLPGLTREENQRWGEAGSAQRLKAISHFLAWLIRFRGSDAPDAREKWAADLVWLRTRYHRASMGFEWPQVARGAARKRTPNAAFMKPLEPDRLLANIIGSAPMPRTEIVSKLWAYIKKHRLQDMENKRMVNADEKLRALFGKDQISMFEMAGLIGKHVR